MIRMGSKYMIAELVDEDVPSNLAQMESWGMGGSRLFKENVTHSGVLFDVLNLATEHNIQSILPQLYLRATQKVAWTLFVHQVVKPRLLFLEEFQVGTKRPDGTRARLHTETQFICALGSIKMIVTEVPAKLARFAKLLGQFLGVRLLRGALPLQKMHTMLVGRAIPVIVER